MPLGITVTRGTRISFRRWSREVLADADDGVGAREHRARDRLQRRGSS